MAVVLGIMAAIIFLVYSVYFVRIIKGNHQEFEQELLAALADWMISTGLAARRQMWILTALAVSLEIAYFALTLLVMDNLLIIAFTGAFAVLETLHIFSAVKNFFKFFAGTIVLKELFEWRVERISAMVFFTHSFLLLSSLIFF